MKLLKSFNRTAVIILALSFLLLIQTACSIATVSHVVSNSGRISVMTPLHVEGSSIKDSYGNTVILRGTGKVHWDDDPTGWWLPISGSGSWQQGYLNWNEANVRANLRAMKSWGMNVVRFHINAEWWLQDTVTKEGYTGSYRDNLKRTYEIAAEEGLYVIMDLFPQANGGTKNYIPWAPYTAASTALFASKQAFVDYWINVANELKDYPNVIFELVNEPHAAEATSLGFTVAQARNDYFDGIQKAITAIRGTGATNLIIVTWGLAAVPHMGWEDACNVNLGYVEQYPLVDPLNGLVYTAHLYRTHLNPIWGPSYNYTDCYAKMVQLQVQYVVQNLSKPVIIGEMGVNMYEDNTVIKSSGLTSLGEELQWARNVLNICNQWGVGYSVWEWSLPSQWQLSSGLPSSAGTAAPTAWGQVLIDSIANGNS